MGKCAATVGKHMGVFWEDQLERGYCKAQQDSRGLGTAPGTRAARTVLTIGALHLLSTGGIQSEDAGTVGFQGGGDRAERVVWIEIDVVWP